MVRLEEITPDNWRIELKVSKEQQDYVSSQAGLLARAYAYRNEDIQKLYYVISKEI